VTSRVSDGSKDLETDVLVLGGGGTGLAAAVSAAEQGAQVMLAEKCKAPGGTTGLSIGSITACCTSYQARHGIIDSPEALFEDMATFNGELDQYDNKELLRVLIREGGATIEWLRSLGFEFVGPSLEPPHRVPRMHNVIPNAVAYPFLFQRAAARKGVKFLLNASGRKLIQEDGRVTGAILDQKSGVHLKVRARRGVILACGDYSGSAFLKERYLSSDLAGIPAYNPDCQGEGHVMGMEVGGRLVNMDIFNRPDVRFIPARRKLWNELLPSHPLLIKAYAAAGRMLPGSVFTRLARSILTTRGAPQDGLYREGAILVNNEGARFTNELRDSSFSIGKQAGGQAYIVFDAQLAQKFSAWPYFVSTAANIAYAYVQDYERDVPDITSKGDTLEEAAKIHPKIGALAETVRRYNRFVERGKDEDFGRWPLGDGITKPPFYVMGPALAYIGVTKGGLDINTRFQVLDNSGQVIPGLFAGGKNGGGLIMTGHGLNLAWAFTSGRLAGAIAARSV
jgi:succinate dehydrogenase/fumarate reductase flavoprotein subunit